MGKFVNVSKIAGCVVSVSLSTAMLMSTAALPVQAKTYSTETISMTQSAKAAKKSTKKSKSSQVSWKNAGKPLQCTVKTERAFYKAMSNAIRLNAPSLKVTLDKSYKGRKIFGDDGLLDVYSDRYLYDLGMSEFGCIGTHCNQYNADFSVVTLELEYSYYGATFPYAYNTGDTSNIGKKDTGMYEIFSEAADNCTETTDLGKAEYAWNWVITHLTYDGRYSGAALTKTFSNPTTDGRYPAVCENYANAYILLMRMLNIPCWRVCVDINPGPGPHAIACAQLNGEYRYFEPTWGKTTTDTAKTKRANPINMTAQGVQDYYKSWGFGVKPYVYMYEVDMNASQQHRELTFSELEEYFIW